MDKLTLCLTDEESKNNIEYVYRQNDRKVEFSRSNSDIWASHARGCKLVTIKTVGDDFTVKCAGQKLELDAAQMAELYYTLNIFTKENNICQDVDVLEVRKRDGYNTSC